MSDQPAAPQPAHVDFVGRQAEMGVLLDGLANARAGSGGLFLIGGEPGIGKSRLADELALTARAQGATALWGRCWDGGGAPAYWPWVQCLRTLLRAQDESATRRLLAHGATQIVQLLPEIEEQIPTRPPTPELDPEAARFRLFEATADLLRQAATSDGLVIVIDDLHAADMPSVLMLRFLAGQLGDSRLQLVATYRDVELTPDHPVTAALAEISREPRARHIVLRGLGVRDVARLAESRTGAAPSAELVSELHRQTSGNPLFVAEAMSLLLAEGGLSAPTDATAVRLAIPGAVREVITRRLSHLSAGCRSVLTIGAVLGPEPSTELLRRLAGMPVEEVLDALDEATKTGLWVETAGGLGRYRFSHELVREVLYDQLSSARRARLHLAAAEALEGLHSKDPDSHLAEIAHHYYRAGPAADPATASGCAARAAAHAVRQLAYEEAVRFYRMALQALELDDSADEHARVDLLLALGDAQMRGGETPRAKETLLGAAATARRLGLSDQLAQAALGYGGRFVWGRAGNDRHLVRLLEDALAALPAGDSVLRARVMARLAGALRDERSPQNRDEISSEAVEMGRRLADQPTLAYALDGRYSAIWAPDAVEERAAIADEIIRVATATGEGERLLQGYHYRLAILLETGDVDAARSQLERNAQLADELRLPSHVWYVNAMAALLHLLQGRYDAAEELISEAFETGRLAEAMYSIAVLRFQQYALRREQGRASETEAALRATVDEYPFWAWARCAMLHFYADLDRRSDARGLLESLAAQDFADLPWDNDWLWGITLIADAVTNLRDAPRAELLYDKMLPYARFAGYGHPYLSSGSLSRPLGTLATVLGRWEAAERHLQEALEMNERMGARPWVAYTQRDHALLLLARAAPGDADRAAALLASARETAQALGMVALQQRLSAMEQEAALLPAADTDDSTAPSAERATFRREGEYWTIVFAADEFRLRDAKGLRYLARLLAEPGREILALDLLGADAGGASAAAVESDLRPAATDAGAALDAEAKQAYRSRLSELQAELDEAEDWHDAERADRARAEMDFIARELARAVGLGGRDRASGSPSERARLSVTRAIRLSMARIAEHSTALGEHLEATVQTGTYCAYRPDPRVPIGWQM